MSDTAFETQTGADSAPLKVISQKIIGWSVRTTEDDNGNTHTIKQAETLERPRVVSGRTYKINPAVTDCAMYITINDITLDDGTVRPLEIFISSKHVAHQQWITALTRMVSAIFRKPGPYLFVAEELEQIYDPQGGYFEGARMMPSVVAHVAAVLREHFEHIGALEKPKLTEVEQVIVTEKKKKAELNGIKGVECLKCHEMTVVSMDGCMTCLTCADSTCA